MQSLILDTIRRVSEYARTNETEFIQRIRQESALQEKEAVKSNKKRLTKAKRRREEITGLVRKLYETYATGKIPESHFTDLINSYDTEVNNLNSEIENLQSEINDYTTDSQNVNRFMALVKKHTEFKEFSAILLREFIEKVIVHEAVKINGKRTMQVDILS